jgi:hypothetical protein
LPSERPSPSWLTFELGFHLLRRAGYDEAVVREVAQVMEYQDAYDLYRCDLEAAAPAGR